MFMKIGHVIQSLNSTIIVQLSGDNELFENSRSTRSMTEWPT